MEDICVSSLFELLFEIAFTYLHKHRHTLILHSLPTNLRMQAWKHRSMLKTVLTGCELLQRESINQ